MQAVFSLILSYEKRNLIIIKQALKIKKFSPFYVFEFEEERPNRQSSLLKPALLDLFTKMIHSGLKVYK